MMHLDENGCFGNGDCDEFNISTSTVDFPTYEKNRVDLFFPIPAKDILYIRKQYAGMFSTYSVIDMYGGTLFSSLNLNNNSIVTEQLTNGVYFIHLSNKNGKNAWQNVVVQR